MKYFYVIKTGFEMLDLSVAYGFSWYLENIKKEIESVVLKDNISHYVIETPDVDFKSTKIILDLLRSEYTNKTSKTSQYTNNLGLATLNRLERKNCLNKLNKFLKNHIEKFGSIFEKFSNLDISSQDISIFGNKKKNYFKLYGSIDARGFKGERKIKKLISYNEGDDYKIPVENLILSIIGISEFGFGQIKRQKPREWVLILPHPNFNQGIKIKFLKEDIAAIKDKMNTIHPIPATELSANINSIKDKMNTIHPSGILATVVLNTLYLEREIKSRKHDIGIDSLFFTHLVGTGQKPKAGKEGKLSLDMLNNLFSSTDEESYNHLIDIWIDLLEISKRKGLEELGYSLSNFLFSPSLSNFERYLKTHLHLYLNPQTKKQFIFKKVDLYNQKLINELTKYVYVSTN